MQRLQNHIAESTTTLPVVGVVALLTWWFGGEGIVWQHLACLALSTLAAYTLMETVARHALLRIRSRMVTVVFVTMLAAFAFLHTNLKACAACLGMTAVWASLFNTFENPESPVQTLHTYLFLALLGALLPPLLWLIPAVAMCQVVFQRSLSWRNIKAALLALCVCLLIHWHDLPAFACAITPSAHLDIWQRMWLDFLPGSGHALSHPAAFLALCYVLLMYVTGVVHYLRRRYADTIEVRMHYYSILVVETLLLVLLILMPQHLHLLLPLLMLATAPAAAHFFALTHTRATNLWFVLCSLLLVGIGILCYHPTLLDLFSHQVSHISLPHIHWSSATELFESWGYWGMLIASFIAGSVFPFSSEAVLTALILAGMNPMRLFIYATIGNIAGSMFNYWVGSLGKMEWVEKYLHVAPEKVDRTKRWMTRYGAWIGLLCFLPVLGSVIAVTLGFTRANPYKSFVAISIGKATRYAILVQIVASLT